MPSLALTVGLLLGALQGAAAPAQQPVLQLPWVFADHMVLQRDEPIAVWGAAPAGAEVRVSLGPSTAQVHADDTGNWQVALPAEAASTEGRPLVVTTEGREVRFEDIVVGDVWLCAGQSNMDFPLERAVGGARAAADLTPATRLRLCNRTGSPGGGRRRLGPDVLAKITPELYYEGGWAVASPETAPPFSAVAFFFGRALADELNVPIGLIDVSVGGSTTEGWVPRARLAEDAALTPLLDDFLATHLSHPFIRERTSHQLGDWIDAGRPEPRPRHFFEPGFLFESAIEPLAPFPIKGVIWYQGESNAHLPRIAGDIFRMLVEEWRRVWKRPELPFYFVQLPGMGRPTWPAFREVQAGWLDDPHLGMAVAIDVGHPTNVHPTNKRPVGERLARVALAKAHGRDVAASGPVPESVRRRGETLSITFEYAKGLSWADGRGPTGFEVAGADRRFYPAQAELDGEHVVLSSPEVTRPTAARYAWSPVPDWSLVNGVGLPAAPFRTHDWRPVRIACIGDSITFGHGLDSPARESYPARLQALLGDGYDVGNFGRSGAGVVLSSMRGTRPRAYRRNAEHQDALLFEPQVVVCNLGINDIMAWGTTGDAFVGDYLRLIGDYRGLSTAPEMLLWGPLAPLFPGQEFHGSPDESGIHGAIARVARQARLDTIDMQAPLRDHPDWFPDHIHPDTRGAEVIAAQVLAGLVEERLVEPSQPTLRLYVMTGQSNALGTTADPKAAERAPGMHEADAEIRFFWSNRSTRAGDGAAALIGDSGGRIVPLQAQQGEGKNTTFWGPEVAFGRTLFEMGERNFVIVKACRGGGGNGFWSKGASDDHMYRHVVDTVEAAVAALPPGTEFETAALLYLQGESDSASEAQAAGRRLGELARSLRRDLPGARGMRVLVGGIAAAGERRDGVREAQTAAAERDADMVYFSNLDLRDDLYDGLHFDRAAKLEVGRRFAEAWTTLSTK